MKERIDMNRNRRKLSKRSIFIIVFLLPAVILFGIIYAYPLLNIFATSFCEWNSKNFVAPEFLGWKQMFDNYIKMFTMDKNFQMALLNSLKWVALTLIIQVPWAVVVSLVLSKKERGWRFTRNMFVCNWFMPGSDVSVLADEKWAFWGVTFAFILFGGSSCLLLLTQIFSIDTAIYEAAKVDGASGLQIDLKITLPLLKPMIGTVAVIAANYGLLLYNEIALISGGGPDNATYSLSYYVYKTALGSERLNFARGNAAGVIQILLGILLVGTINKMFHSRKEEL